jgi:O-antigen ligase
MATIQQQGRGQVVWWSVGSRAEVQTTAHAAGDFLPFGSGFGSFQTVYRLYEDPDRITTGNVIHAHDDYLELALEMGLPGILLLIGFLVWWTAASARVWRKADALPFARAASIVSALILFDGLVDFPLRTASVGIIFAMCLALLVDRRRRSRSELWPTRHIVLE